MNKSIFLQTAGIILFGLIGCRANKMQVKELKTLTVEGSKEKLIIQNKYQSSAKRIVDILHTDIFITPQWENKTLQAKAIIYLKPYFYSIKSFELDAKAFMIGEISIEHRKQNLNFQVNYDNYKIRFELNKEISNVDTLRIEIDYTTNTYEIEKYCDDLDPYEHGFYFITPDVTTPTKPYQLWTQNEPQAASLWFPTVDEPNEKMTHSLTITLGDSLVTLSNGELALSVKNIDGTRTDKWVMNQPHAPYLVALIAGKYSIVKDSYKGKDVWYYVEPEYEKYAKNILGNTVEMIEFFSDKLGVEYPWNKYHQVFVRDYVSGAMENTTCVVLGEYIQQTDREQLGNSHETTIAHELFHHWFGDLVTCESWANLPLNESFANYSEYLWLEYKYGRDAADYHHKDDMEDYFYEAISKNEPLIRYYNKGPEEMFDAHSYNKGGRVLHMLRGYVGDEAFFKSLQLYLTKLAYKSAEIHDLRLAFEEVTGEDLNWFFNQWFLNKGYPSLEITYEYKPKEKIQEITIVQNHEASFGPLFTLPIDVDIYHQGSSKRHRIWVTQAQQTFQFKDITSKPDWISIDADKILLCKKFDNKTTKEFVLQFKEGKNIIDKIEALEYFATLEKNKLNKDIYSCIWEALNSSIPYLRKEALKLISLLPETYLTEIKDIIKKIILYDKDTDVRIEAINVSDLYLSKDDLISTLQDLTNDKSWEVVNASLLKLVKHDALYVAKFSLNKINEDQTSSSFIATVAQLFSDLGSDTSLAYLYFNNFTYLKNCFHEMKFLHAMANFFSRSSLKLKEYAAVFFIYVILNDPMWYTRLAAYDGLKTIYESCLKDYKNTNEINKKIELENLIQYIFHQYNSLYLRERNTKLLSNVSQIK